MLSNNGLLSSRISTTNGLRYVIYTPLSVLMGKFDHIVLTVNLISVILMAFMIFLGYLSSRRVYRPVQSVVEMLRKNHSEAGIASENETEFIQKHVLDIVSANYRLQSTVEDSSPLVLETVLFKLLRGSPSVEETLEFTAEPYGINFQNGLYGVLVIRMELQPDSDEQFETRYDKRFHEILSAVLDHWLISIVETRMDEYAVVTYCTSDEDGDALKEQFSLLHADLRREIPRSSFMMGFGGYVSNVMELRESYLQALNAIRHRHVGDDSPVLEWAEQSVLTYFLPVDFEVELTAMLRGGQFDTARAYISEQFDKNLKSGICVEEYLQMCYLVNGFLLRFIRNKNTILYRDTISIDPHTSLYSAQRLNEIVFFNLSVLTKYAANPSVASESAIERVIRYVEEHFTEDINLTIVSNQLGYTSNYISRLFKQTKGMNFTDYINRKRVERAKTLLRSGSKTIKQIAQNVGFNSATLFIRTFERYEGMTPGEYRKLRA
ncbi:helix-turn-helix domain-containing protein [Ruthenibacterium lactatiformans]|uniref:helix-turn-helix domain-containing protein n=1 Tax=Ruthenibacterium lactatiformans TaxID=1550024 RepID=UPI001967E3B5|nr:helix-turn-helix domain-containing protein [Ruthenibacterium lactatiformans]MBN3010229.1 helix-turn-helix domain-containing protein [Ruthenibacterium lactatiformans]